MSFDATTYTAIPRPIGASSLLTPLDKLILSDVLSFIRNGQTYFRSTASIAEHWGASQRAIKYRIKRLLADGYLIIIEEGKSRLTNVLGLGPATIALIGEPIAMRKVDPVAVEPSSDQKPPLPDRKPVPPPVQPLLRYAEDKIPTDVFRTLDLNPTKGRDLSPRDAETVFALYGLGADKAERWMTYMTAVGWQTGDRLEAAKTGAVTLRDNPNAYPKPCPRFDYDDL